MISTPVAVVRGLLISIVVWGVSAGVTLVAFHAMGAHTTIADVSGQSRRVQIVWSGAHAFSACIGGLLGVGVGGTALVRGHVRGPLAAVGLVAGPIVAVAATVIGVLAITGQIGTPLSEAASVGLLIGLIGGGAYVLQSDVSADVTSPYPEPRRAQGRSWGSR